MNKHRLRILPEVRLNQPTTEQQQQATPMRGHSIFGLSEEHRTLFWKEGPMIPGNIGPWEHRDDPQLDSKLLLNTICPIGLCGVSPFIIEVNLHLYASTELKEPLTVVQDVNLH